MSSKTTGNDPLRAALLKYWPWIAMAVIILFTSTIRIRLLQIPLERDEGEFAYMGQLMLQGIPPYHIAYNMKLPGIYAAYALIMAIFGQTIAGVHIGLLLSNALAVVILFFLARRLFDPVAAVGASASYALLSLSPGVLGTSAHATQFIVPLALGATLLLLQAIDSGKYRPLFISGLLFGLAFLMKQHAIFFAVFAWVYLLWIESRTRPLSAKRIFKRSACLVIASAIPFVISCLLLYASGSFANFWFWTFSYGRRYVSEIPLSAAARHLGQTAPIVIKPGLWIWIMAGIGLTAVFWNKAARSKWQFLVGMVLFSFLTICPGFYFRTHYYITMLPIIAILAGLAMSAMMQLLSGRRMHPAIQILPVLIMATALLHLIVQCREFFFLADPVRACRMMYGTSPFPESLEIARYIREHTTSNDKIAVFGSEPQIFFYANRKSATGYIYVYPLTEPHDLASKMQSDMIREIEGARPRYVVLVNIDTSWFQSEVFDPALFRWAEHYFGNQYRVAGLVDIPLNADYRAYWDDEARRNSPQSESHVYVLERIGD